MGIRPQCYDCIGGLQAYVYEQDESFSLRFPHAKSIHLSSQTSI